MTVLIIDRRHVLRRAAELERAGEVPWSAAQIPTTGRILSALRRQRKIHMVYYIGGHPSYRLGG